MTEIIIFLLTIIASFLFVWLFAYRPFINIQRQLSIKIISEIIPDIQSSHNLITTLSGSAILLSFAVLQAFKDKKLTYLTYLENSWYLFGASVLFGVLAGIVIYILKAHSSVMIKVFMDQDNGKDVPAERLKDLLDTKKRHQNILFVFLLAQSVTFVSAIAFLIVFARSNLS